MSITLDEAEKIVKQYGAVLEREGKERPDDGPASYSSHLTHSPEKIVQAMKLWLAHDIQRGSLSEEFRNTIGTAASRLGLFVEDEKARRLNAIRSNFSAEKRGGLSTEEFIVRAKAIEEVHEWTTNAGFDGVRLRSELSDFIATVERFDRADNLYWQRVYTLAGLEYPVAKNRSRWKLFESRSNG